MPIEPFGWVDNASPALSAENLELDRQQVGGYVDDQIVALQEQISALQSEVEVLQSASGAVTPPSIIAIPTLSGTTVVGDALTCAHGTWTNDPTGYAYQWVKASTANGSFINVSGATNASYTLQADDAGDYFKCQVTASNTAGFSAAVSSVATTQITSSVVTPVNSVAPTISGVAIVNEVLSANAGTWSGSPTFAYQWNRAGATITAATSANYTLQSADQGDAITVTVTATNSAGSASVTSAATSAVTASQTLTLSNMTASASGSTVTVTVDCSPDLENVTLTTGSEFGTAFAPDDAPENGVASWTVTNVAAGSYTLYCLGYTVAAGQSGGSTSNQETATVTVTGVAPTPISPPVIS